MAIVVGVGSTLFGTITAAPTGDITLEQAAAHILAAIAVFGLAIFAPGIAAGLISGAPQLGAGAAVGIRLSNEPSCMNYDVEKMAHSEVRYASYYLPLKLSK